METRRHKDLVILVADGAIEAVIRTLVRERTASLGIRSPSFDLVKDPLHDSSPESKSIELLRPFVRTHKHALVLRDLAGSGWENPGAEKLEAALVESLCTSGWTKEDIDAIVIEPEVEIWLRLKSVHTFSLAKAGARRNTPVTGRRDEEEVNGSLSAHGGEHHGKPARPKECFESVLERFGIPRSNALYGELASKESLH